MGIPTALLAARLIASMLFGLSPGDPKTVTERLPAASPCCLSWSRCLQVFCPLGVLPA